jgi:hypothetical protein
LAPVSAFGESRDLSLDFQPTFAEMPAPSVGMEPVTVTVSNRGNSAQGVLRVRAQSYEMAYPVELPSGSVKKFIVYLPATASYETPELALETDQGSVAREWREAPTEDSAERPLLLIGGAEGSMSFMRARLQAKGSAGEESIYPRDVYARPGEVPDRAVGYSGLRAVILGEGSERLTDAEVRALQTWVIAGGTVVMLGGASCPILSDPRWAGFAPVSGATAATIPVPAGLGELAKTEPPVGSVAVMRGVASPGCSVNSAGGVPYLVTRSAGLGKVVFLAFDLFEPPLDTWGGRARLLSAITGGGYEVSAFDWLSPVENDMAVPRSISPGVSVYSSGPRAPGYRPELPNNPFTVKLPPAATVVFILLGYLVLAVPVNLIVLRKLNRSSWAWVTTPLLSLAFAAVFFQYAGGLYAADLSVENSGVLVFDTDYDTGYYVGETQLFFPRGGTYDLRLQNVEAVVPTMDEAYVMSPGQGRNSMATLNATDVGQVVVDHLAATNLNFHQFSFAQTVPTGKWLDARIALHLTGAGRTRALKASGTILNRSPYEFSGTLIAGSYVANLEDLKSGAQLDASSLAFKHLGVGQQFQFVGSSGRLSDQPVVGHPNWKRPVIQGVIKGFRPGSQIGRETQGGSVITVFAVIGDAAVPKEEEDR